MLNNNNSVTKTKTKNKNENQNKKNKTCDQYCMYILCNVFTTRSVEQSEFHEFMTYENHNIIWKNV